MARASFATLLALDRWAAILGINPAHFNGASGESGAGVMPAGSTCDQLWFQHSWQAGDRLSREELALAICQAERDIANFLHYWPAPVWTCDEAQPYPRHFRPEVLATGGVDTRGLAKAVQTDYHWVIAPGCRAVEEVAVLYRNNGDGVGALEYLDEDGDGYAETAQATFASTASNLCELKLYFAGHAADPAWEIRPLRTRQRQDGNVTLRAWSWQLIRPELWEELPTGEGVRGLDLAADIYVDHVEVWREYNDPTCVSARFTWLRPVGCSTDACDVATQDGCFTVRDGERGIVVPQPAETWAVGRDPDWVRLWYLSGLLSNDFRCGRTCEPLSDWWASTIATLAAARLTRPPCACPAVVQRVTDLQRDMAFTPPEGGAFALDMRELGNPFGTRKGEILAYRRIRGLASRVGKAAVL